MQLECIYGVWGIVVCVLSCGYSVGYGLYNLLAAYFPTPNSALVRCILRIMGKMIGVRWFAIDVAGEFVIRNSTLPTSESGRITLSLFPDPAYLPIFIFRGFACNFTFRIPSVTAILIFFTGPSFGQVFPSSSHFILLYGRGISVVNLLIV